MRLLQMQKPRVGKKKWKVEKAVCNINETLSKLVRLQVARSMYYNSLTQKDMV